MKKNIVLPAFVIMVLAQLYVPSKMIWQSEQVLTTGTEFRFRAAPVDPNDPFRGKYITLSYLDNRLTIDHETDLMEGDQVFVLLTTDSAGFASLKSVTKEEPAGEADYLQTTVDYVLSDSVSTIFIRYPFNRFYMEESKAPLAEQLYMDASRDTDQVVYALVMVSKGRALLSDVVINGKSISEAIKKQN